MTDMKSNKETQEQILICNYIKGKGLIFFSDLFDRISNQITRIHLHNLRSGSNPDIFICEPRGKYKGLFIEMKKTGTKLLNKKLDFASEHIKNQAEIIDKLRSKGYAAEFACGYNEAKYIIDEYLNIKK